MRIIIDTIVIILLCGSCLTMTLPSEKPATDVAAQCFLNNMQRPILILFMHVEIIHDILMS